MKRSLSLFALLLSNVCHICNAQDNSNFKFGKISSQDFVKSYSIDSNANAVILADIGSAEYLEGFGFNYPVEYKIYRRAHILNRKGYNIANVEIFLTNGQRSEETLDNLTASTYNLENGKVVETKLDTKSSLFTDKLNKNFIIKKFTFPNIKEGSIIEYEYKVTSPFNTALRSWSFQGEYPRLLSEYSASIPEYFYYFFLTQGYQSFYINDKKVTRNRGITYNSPYTYETYNYRWIMKDVPALKTENYVSTINNYIDKIEFQISEMRLPPTMTPQPILGSWKETCDKLLKSETFGADLNRNNGWLSDVIKPLINGAKDNTEKAKRIYEYVRDNINCTYHGGFGLSEPLKTVLKDKKGIVSDINLLLIAMLRHIDIKADPVLLSTRPHGFASSVYPILEKYNCLVCLAHIDGKDIFLDASEPRLGFGRLSSDCYNGTALVVNDKGDRIELKADSLHERKFTTISASVDEKGNMDGAYQQTPGYYESYQIRNKVKEKGMDDFFDNEKKSYGPDVTLADQKIDSLNQLDENIQISYDFKLNLGKNDVIYLNPMFDEGLKENPLKSEKRFYPVEMPYPTDEIYILTLNIPDGYYIDELPKSTVIKYDEDGNGQFEYRISASDGTISLISKVTWKKAFFQPEEYVVLREFFNLIVKKQNEQIVLKKKQ